MTTKTNYYSTSQKIKYMVDDPIHQIHEFNIDYKANHIYLFGEESYISSEAEGAEPGVEFSMANRFIKNLNILMRTSDKPILIHMKTCGGMWGEGMAIHNAIKACPNEICILNYTHARSMSSIIFQAGDKRVMMPDSTFMFHEGTMGFSGTVKQYFTEAEQLVKTNQRMLQIYVERMQQKGEFEDISSGKIKNWLKRKMNSKEEVYLSADETVKYGLADEVFGANGTYDWDDLLNFR